MDFAHLDAGQYKHSVLGLLDFHPVPRVPFPQRPMRTPPLRVSLIFCFNLLCSAAPTTMANPESPSSIWLTTVRPPQQSTQKLLQLFRTQQHQHQKPGQHPEPQNGSAVRTRSNSATPDRTAPCACARLILQVKDQNRVSNGQCATTSSTSAAWPISSHTTTGLHAPLAATHGHPRARTNWTSNAASKGTFGRSHPTHCRAEWARPQPRSRQHRHHPSTPSSCAAPAFCWSTPPTQNWMKHGRNFPTFGT